MDEMDLIQLPLRDTPTTNQKVKPKICYICWEKINAGTISLSCHPAHLFCIECLQTWVTSKAYCLNEDVTCPVCRQPYYSLSDHTSNLPTSARTITVAEVFRLVKVDRTEGVSSATSTAKGYTRLFDRTAFEQWALQLSSPLSGPSKHWGQGQTPINQPRKRHKGVGKGRNLQYGGNDAIHTLEGFLDIEELEWVPATRPRPVSPVQYNSMGGHAGIMASPASPASPVASISTNAAWNATLISTSTVASGSQMSLANFDGPIRRKRKRGFHAIEEADLLTSCIKNFAILDNIEEFEWRAGYKEHLDRRVGYGPMPDARTTFRALLNERKQEGAERSFTAGQCFALREINTTLDRWDGRWEGSYNAMAEAQRLCPGIRAPVTMETIHDRDCIEGIDPRSPLGPSRTFTPSTISSQRRPNNTAANFSRAGLSTPTRPFKRQRRRGVSIDSEGGLDCELETECFNRMSIDGVIHRPYTISSTTFSPTRSGTATIVALKDREATMLLGGEFEQGQGVGAIATPEILTRDTITVSRCGEKRENIRNRIGQRSVKRNCKERKRR